MITRRLQYELVARAAGPLLLRLEAWQAQLKRRRRGPRKPGPFGPPLEATAKLKELMTLHYLAGRWADGAVPVAWVTSGFPVELLRALGFFAIYPENHAAMCSVRRLVPELSEVVEKEGYSRDLCGYARCDLGSVRSQRTPVGRVPKPDLLCCCTNICETVLYWYRALAAHYRVPLVVIDTPFVYGAPRPHDVQFVRDQLEELVTVAERVSGRRTEPERLETVVRLAREGTQLWGECLGTGRRAPSPWTGFDSFFHMAPIVALRGTEECNAYYRLLRDELETRVMRGIGGVTNERVRLLWDNLPIWFNLREMATLLAERGFNFVVTTYTNAWAEAGEMIDPRDPIGSAARAYVHVILNCDLGQKLRLMQRLAREYGAQGAILHSDRSCKPYSIGQVDLKDRLAASGLKVLLLEADHADPRAYSAEQGETRLAAFMESFA
ncbi:MAG TPA: 2-hydroxyacyl-CoA dehydratase family protein [Polyangia bacterium]|jgi:benzoyl-CoA reductase/2-hydroxyglutaryl-CoA dehydratase subunit BcrC/BadD/HgdB